MALFNAFIVGLVGLFAAGALAMAPNAPYSNFRSTETAAPQELGSMTVAGSLVYSMNMCTIVHNTECYVALSTGGPAPVVAPSAAPGGSKGSSAASPKPASSAPPAGEKPAPTIVTTTDAAGASTVITRTAAATGSESSVASSSAVATGEASAPGTTAASATGVPAPNGGDMGSVRLAEGAALAALALAGAVALF